LVAYGGFIGGYLGSWADLANQRIRLMPWAGVAGARPAAGVPLTRLRWSPLWGGLGKGPLRTAPPVPQNIGTVPPPAAGDARERRRIAGVRAPPRALSRDAARRGADAHERVASRASYTDLRVALRPLAPRDPPLAAQKPEVPRADLLHVRLRLRLPALPP